MVQEVSRDRREHLELPGRAQGWFTNACVLLHTNGSDVSSQWSFLAKVTAITGTPAQQVGTTAFEAARTAIIDAYVDRGMPTQDATASIFH